MLRPSHGKHPVSRDQCYLNIPVGQAEESKAPYDFLLWPMVQEAVGTDSFPQLNTSEG